eukprot:3026365-Rhodomonas_salina.2
MTSYFLICGKRPFTQTEDPKQAHAMARRGERPGTSDLGSELCDVLQAAWHILGQDRPPASQIVRMLETTPEMDPLAKDQSENMSLEDLGEGDLAWALEESSLDSRQAVSKPTRHQINPESAKTELAAAQAAASSEEALAADAVQEQADGEGEDEWVVRELDSEEQQMIVANVTLENDIEAAASASETKHNTPRTVIVRRPAVDACESERKISRPASSTRMDGGPSMSSSSKINLASSIDAGQRATMTSVCALHQDHGVEQKPEMEGDGDAADAERATRASSSDTVVAFENEVESTANAEENLSSAQRQPSAG